MANDHPFQLLFESFGRLPPAHAESVNREAREELVAVLDLPVDGSGRCILLRAPRAGHGKTHLLTRVQHHLGGSHEFIPLHAAGSRVDALSVTEDALKRLTRPLPAAGGLTVLDLLVRRLFAYALQPLVISGEVPCQDREGALTALKARPIETFDFHHPNAVTAHWARDNFEVLGPRISMELAQRSSAAIREISFWVNAFFRYAATPVDHPGRAGALGFEVAGEAMTETVSMDRLLALLALMSLLTRVVLVADDLEGFSADETAALKFAAFVGAVRQAVDRVDVILSLNQDVWENAFLPRLSGGLADRLSEVVIELQPLGEEDVVALFDSRAPGLGQQVLERADLSERHARGLIRAAGEAWMKATAAARVPVALNVPDPRPEPEPFVEAKAEEKVETESDDPFTWERTPETLAEDPLAGPELPADAIQPTSDFSSLEVHPEPDFLETEYAGQATEVIQAAPVSEPTQWGSGSVFEAKVMEEPDPPRPFSDPLDNDSESPFRLVPPEKFPAVSPPPLDPSPFDPVTEELAANPPYPRYSDDTAKLPSDFGPPAFSPPTPASVQPPPIPPAQPALPAEEGDRVDDLLKQFRERYGRGSGL